MSTMSRFDQRVVGYTEWVVRWRWLVIALSVVAVVLLTAGVRQLRFSTDYREYFGPGNPQLQAFDEVQNVYTKNDYVLLMFEPKRGDIFEPRFLDAIRKFTADSWKLPYSLRVDSITNFQHTEAAGDDLRVSPLLPDDAEITAGRIAKLREVALHEPQLIGRLISERGHVTAVVITSQLPPVEQQTRRELPATVLAARALRDRYLQEYPEIGAIYITGANPMSYAFTEAAAHDLKTLMPAMYVAIFVIMWLMLRSGGATLSTLLVVFFSSLSAMGLAGYLGIGLTPPVVQAPLVIMVLAVADSVHISLTMFELMREGWEKRKAIVESMRVNFVPVLLVNATTSICFLGTNFTDSPPLTALGNITAIGGVLSWLLAMSLLPALLAIVPARVPKERKSRFVTVLMDRNADLVLRHRGLVLWGTLAVVVGLTALVPLNEANDNFTQYFGKNMEFRRDNDHVAQQLTGTTSIEFSLTSGEDNGISNPAFLKKVEAFEQWWKTGPYKDKIYFVGTITDMYKKLNRNMHRDDPAWYQLPDNQELAAQYLLLYEMSLPFGLDLNNQVNVAKSSTRFVVVFKALKSKETRQIALAAEQWRDAHAPGLFTHGVGPQVMFAHIAERNIKSNFYSLPLSLAAISLLLLPGLRSLRFGLLSLIPNLLPLGVAFGIWALVSGEIIFTMAVVINIVVGIVVDNTVHFFNKYLRARRQMRLGPDDSVRYALRESGSAMIVTTLILATGFLILAQSSFLPNSTMSLLTTIAILVALPIDLLLLPALVLLADREQTPPAVAEHQEIQDEPLSA